MANKPNQDQKRVTVFFDGKSGGYSSKELWIPSMGIYEVTEEQKRYLLKTFPENFCEPESPKAKRPIAKQKELAEIKAGEKVRENPPPWDESLKTNKEGEATDEKNEDSTKAKE